VSSVLRPRQHSTGYMGDGFYINNGVTRGQLPQRAGSLDLNGGGAAAAVPPLVAL